MIIFVPHVGSGSTPLKGLSFHVSYKTTWLALIVYTNHCAMHHIRHNQWPWSKQISREANKVVLATVGPESILPFVDSEQMSTCAVTTLGLNVMHSGHVRLPGIIFLYLSMFHSTITPVLCMILIYFLWYITLCPDTIYKMPFTLLYSYINCTTR